jgi:nitrogen-specific signal transduction histidine kinase
MECPTPAPVEALLDAFPLSAAVVTRGSELIAANASFGERAGDAARANEVRRAVARLDREEHRTLHLRLPSREAWTVHLHRLRHDPEQVLVVLEPVLGGDSLHARLADLEARIDELRRMKHEISNPLMGLVGHAELLASDAALDADTRHRARAILEQARRICEQVTAVHHTPERAPTP